MTSNGKKAVVDKFSKLAIKRKQNFPNLLIDGKPSNGAYHAFHDQDGHVLGECNCEKDKNHFKGRITIKIKIKHGVPVMAATATTNKENCWRLKKWLRFSTVRMAAWCQ